MIDSKSFVLRQADAPCIFEGAAVCIYTSQHIRFIPHGRTLDICTKSRRNRWINNAKTHPVDDERKGRENYCFENFCFFCRKNIYLFFFLGYRSLDGRQDHHELSATAGRIVPASTVYGRSCSSPSLMNGPFSSRSSSGLAFYRSASLESIQRSRRLRQLALQSSTKVRYHIKENPAMIIIIIPPSAPCFHVRIIKLRKKISSRYGIKCNNPSSLIISYVLL